MNIPYPVFSGFIRYRYRYQLVNTKYSCHTHYYYRLVSSRLVLPPLQGALWHPRSQDRSIARACAYDKTRTKLEHATALVIFSGHHCVAALCCSIVSSANVSSPLIGTRRRQSVCKGGQQSAQIRQQITNRLQQSDLLCVL